jgi:hypothetical protein
MNAGTTQLISDGRTSPKNPVNGTFPACQTISVVMSPNGLKAPPASGCHHDIDAREWHEQRLPASDRHRHCPEQQPGREIVGDGRYHTCHGSRQPEQRSQRQTGRN